MPCRSQKILLERLQDKIKREESQKSWEERRKSTVLELQFIQLVQSGPFHSPWSEPGLRVVLVHAGNTSLKTPHPRSLCLLLQSTSPRFLYPCSLFFMPLSSQRFSLRFSSACRQKQQPDMCYGSEGYDEWLCHILLWFPHMLSRQLPCWRQPAHTE